MDHSICSIGESSFSDIIDITEIENATFSEMKIIGEKLDQEVDEDLVSAFNDISENDDKSEDDSESDDHERNLHTDSSFTSERDLSLVSSAANPIADQRSNIEFENGLTKEDSYNETEENEKNKLSSQICIKTSNLQDSQNLISEREREENKLLEELTALKLQLSSLKEAEDLALEKNSELQRKNQELQMEVKWVKQIYEEFLAQKKCQLFLESGTIEEINRLKLQIHHLEEEKSRIERENSLLKESFFQRWARSLLLWQFQCVRRVGSIIGSPFF